MTYHLKEDLKKATKKALSDPLFKKNVASKKTLETFHKIVNDSIVVTKIAFVMKCEKIISIKTDLIELRHSTMKVKLEKGVNIDQVDSQYSKIIIEGDETNTIRMIKSSFGDVIVVGRVRVLDNKEQHGSFAQYDNEDDVPKSFGDILGIGMGALTKSFVKGLKSL